MTPLEAFVARLKGARKSGDGWSAQCPAHDDRKASMSVSESPAGKLLIHCHAGCSFQSIMAAVGLTARDGFPEPPENGQNGEYMAGKKGANRKTSFADLGAAISSIGLGKPSGMWHYHAANGDILGAVARWDKSDGKTFRPLSCFEGLWQVGAMPHPKPLYGLPKLLECQPHLPVIIVEGEKTAESARAIGFVATTSAGGSQSAAQADWAPLAGKEVWIFPDNDEPGRKYAEDVAGILIALTPPAIVKVIELPGLPEKGDFVEWVDSHGEAAEPESMFAEIEAMADKCAIWQPASQRWPEIMSFDELDLPRFPTRVLPDELRYWVEAESHATQTPPDLAGLLAIAVCSAGIARRIEVEVRAGWREPVNVFVAVLLEPGNRKSAVFSDAIRPLRDFEAALIERRRPEVAQAQSRRRIMEKGGKKKEELAATRGDSNAAREAEQIAMKLAEEPEPVLPRLIIDDATAEKVGMMLADQGGRIASMSPEGGVFDLMAGQYSKNGIPHFTVYLMGHSGDDLITDRVSRTSVRVRRPALTCAYAIQPAVIEGLAKEQAFRGRGLLGRFLYARPPSWIGEREIAAQPVSADVQRMYYEAVQRLAGGDVEVVLHLSMEAAASLEIWEREIEKMLGDGGTLEKMRDWGGKLAGETIRLAAIFHCIKWGPVEQIDLQTLNAAIETARYLVPHAEAALRLMSGRESRTEDDAYYLLRWIDRHQFPHFTKSEAQHHGKRRFPRADLIDLPLAELVRRGYIRPRPEKPSGPGRPQSPMFDVNPAVTAGWDLEKRSFNSRNWTNKPSTNGFGNIGSALEETPEGIEVPTSQVERRQTSPPEADPPAEQFVDSDIPGNGLNRQSPSSESEPPSIWPLSDDADLPSAYRHGF